MYKVSDAGDGKKYFAQITNIIDSLDISPYAARLYMHFKRVAGEDGYCSESLRTMEEKLKISHRKIVSARRELEQPRDELGGKSLISCETQPNRPGVKGYTMIVIQDIWLENIQYCEKKNALPRSPLRATTERVTSTDVARNALPRSVK